MSVTAEAPPIDGPAAERQKKKRKSPAPRRRPEPSSKRLLSGAEAAVYCGLSRATWGRLRSAGATPNPVYLVIGKAARWRASDLDKWLESLPASRRD